MALLKTIDYQLCQLDGIRRDNKTTAAAHNNIKSSSRLIIFVAAGTPSGNAFTQQGGHMPLNISRGEQFDAAAVPTVCL